jgi:hypothetical protein
MNQIKLSPNTAQAVRASMAHVNQLSEAAKFAQREFETAAQMHQRHMSAIILDAGYKVADFQHYGLFEDTDGAVYLRATTQEQKP